MVGLESRLTDQPTEYFRYRVDHNQSGYVGEYDAGTTSLAMG